TRELSRCNHPASTSGSGISASNSSAQSTLAPYMCGWLAVTTRSPPSERTASMACWSMYAGGSHRTFPSGVHTSSPRCPTPRAGSVPIPWRFGSTSPTTVSYPASASCAIVVHRWPVGGTHCRSSTQISQTSGGCSASGSCAPQVGQIHTGMYSSNTRRRRDSLEFRHERHCRVRPPRHPLPKHIGGSHIVLVVSEQTFALRLVGRSAVHRDRVLVPAHRRLAPCLGIPPGEAGSGSDHLEPLPLGTQERIRHVTEQVHPRIGLDEFGHRLVTRNARHPAEALCRAVQPAVLGQCVVTVRAKAQPTSRGTRTHITQERPELRERTRLVLAR